MTKPQTYTFPNEAVAERILREAGFAIGTLQGGAPRGLMHGDYVVMKWRNLGDGHRETLHGVYARHDRGGPVTVKLFDRCPAEGRGVLLRLVQKEALPPVQSAAHSERASASPLRKAEEASLRVDPTGECA